MEEIPGLDIFTLENPMHFFNKDVFQYNFLSILGPGKVFGELGILNNKPRAATVVALENTHFAILLKKDYQNILASI